MGYSDRFQELLSYWLDVKGDEPLPNRKEFNPRHIISLISRVMILERDLNDSQFYVRLSGSDLDSRFGRSVKDMEISDVFGESGHWASRGHKPVSPLDDLVRLIPSLLDRPMGLAGKCWWQSVEGDFPCYFIFLPFCTKTSGCHKVVGQIDFEPRHNLGGVRRLSHWRDIEELRPIDLGFGLPDTAQGYSPLVMDSLTAA